MIHLARHSIFGTCLLGLSTAAPAVALDPAYDDQVAAKAYYDDQSTPGNSIGSAGAPGSTSLTMDRDGPPKYSYNWLWNGTDRYIGHTGTPGELKVWFHDHPENPHYHYKRLVNNVVVETGYLY